MTRRTHTEGHTRVQWAATVLASTTVLTYGLQCGWMSPMAKVLQSDASPVGRPLTDNELSFIAAIPNLSAVLGILVLVYVVDTFGRRWAMIIIATSQLMCWVFTLCPASVTTLGLARVCCGLGGGGCFHIVPMYIKEIGQDDIRGRLGSMVVLNQYVGILVMYALGGFLSYYTVVYVVVLVPALTVILLFKLPESPSFLIKINKPEEAAAVVSYLRGLPVHHKLVHNQLELINKEDEYFKSIPNMSFFNIFREKAWRRGFLLAGFIITVRSMNGAYSIINYASIMLSRSNVALSVELQTLAIPVGLLLGTLFTITCVDKLGRKALLVLAMTITTLCETTLASTELLREHGYYTPAWILLLALACVVCCYGGGISPLPFIIMSEMFNFQVRAKLTACLCIHGWLVAFVQLTAFTFISSHLGPHAAFFMFGLINLIGTVVVFIFLPETKGKSVEQIESELRNDKCVTNTA